MTIEINPAQPGDLADVEAIVTGAYTPWVDRIGQRPGPLNDDYAALIAAGRVHILQRSNTPAGVLVLIPETDAMLLDNIAVSPDHHGQGLGRILMAFAEAEARRQGFSTIRLYTHEKMAENIAIYARRGFVETHRAREKGFARVFMEKALPSSGSH